MFGPCKVCAEKDRSIAAMQAEVSFLRSLVRPDIPRNAHRPTAEQIEADAVISGHDREIFIDENSRFIENPLPRMSAEEEAVLRERDALLSSNY